MANTAPGATLALGLIYLRTNDAAAAARIVLPATQPALDAVRPDLLQLRVVARSLLLWDSVVPSLEWVHSQLPPILRAPGGPAAGRAAAA